MEENSLKSFYPKGSTLKWIRHKVFKTGTRLNETKKGGVSIILTFLPISIVSLVFTTTPGVNADSLSCHNITGISCVGSGSTSTCYPTVSFLTPYLESVYDSGGGRWAKFCVSVGGSGYGGPSFDIQVHYRESGGGGGGYGTCSRPNADPLSCVECTEQCMTHAPISVSGDTAVYFWATACNLRDQGQQCACDCSSDTVWVPIPSSGGVPDTTPVILPTQIEKGSMTCDEAVGQNPINAKNGNEYYNQLDVSMPTDRGLPLTLTRHYNSYDTLKSSLSYNWRHSFEYHLSKDAFGNYSLVEPTGRILKFKQLVFDQESPPFQMVRFAPPFGVFSEFAEDATNNILTVNLEDETKLIFVDTGKIDTVKDLQGNSIHFFYNSNNLDSISNSSNRKLYFKHTVGRLDSVLSSGGTLVKYEYYSADSNLKKVTYPDGSWDQYVYDTSSINVRRITAIQRSNGPTLNFTYDTLGRANSFFKSGKKELHTLSWTVDESTSPDSIHNTIVNPNGTMTVTSFWSPDYSTRNVVYKSNPNCAECAVKFSYNDWGLKRTIEYANGTRDSFSYDVRGNLLDAVYGTNTSLKQHTKYRHESRFNRQTAEIKKSIANLADTMTSTRFLYHANGTCTTMVDSGWRDGSNRFVDTTKFSYNSAGQVLKIFGPRSNVVDTVGLAYHSNGDLQTITLANGDITTFGQRNDLGHRTWVRGPNGDTTRYFFDTRGRLTKVQEMSGTSDSANTTFSYTVDGDILSTTSPIGGTLNFVYTPHGYIDSLYNSRNWRIKYSYDSSGNPLSEKVYDSAGTLRREESYIYDSKNQLKTILDANSDSTRFKYTAVGDIDTVYDALDKKTIIVYDSLRRITESIQFAATGDTIRTKYFYDTRNNVTKVTDPSGFDYVYRYDDKNRLTVDSSAIYGKSLFGYDAANNLSWEKNSASDSIAYKYDALNRLTDIKYPDSQNIKYIYDGTEYSYGKGRLYLEVTPACTTKYRYDSKGRVQQVRQKITGDVTYGFTYLYDKNNNLTTLEYPSGSVLIYVYDNMDNVIKVEAWKNGDLQKVLADSIKYSPYGRPTYWKLGNGIKVSNIYDKLYLVDSIWTGADNIMKWDYDINKVGNITQITDNLDTLQTRRFQYDDIFRLTQSVCKDYPVDTLRFRYFNNGNRDSLITSGGMSADVISYKYLKNRLDTVYSDFAVPVRYIYDSLGNVIKRKATLGSDSTTYVYNDASRLTSFFKGADTSLFYYDARNRRVKEVQGGSGTKFLYNAAGQIMSEFDLNGTHLADYAYLNGVLLAKMTLVPPVNCPDTGGGGIESMGGGGGEAESGPGGGDSCATIIQPYYYHTDHLGTPWYMTSQAKSIVWRGEYLPFGELYSETVSQTNLHRFPGQYKVQNTLYYNWNRWYDPKIGRYLQADPIGLEGGTNLFAYVGNNPPDQSDATGLGFWSALSNYIDASNRAFTFANPVYLTNAYVGSYIWSLLPNNVTSGSVFGTGYGTEAVDYFANQYGNNGNPLYFVGGTFAALWTPETWFGTATTLAAARPIGRFCEVPRYYWQYYPAGNSSYASSWLAGSNSLKAPYALGQPARQAFNLPPWNPGTAVRRVNIKWWEPVRGPRTPKPRPDLGWQTYGTGKEYIRGLKWKD